MYNNLTDWADCKNILCIRTDNMGDLLMSSPAIRALKETFHGKITLLTSPMAKPMAHFLPDIDDVIVFDVPWVKGMPPGDNASFQQTVDLLLARQFDAAVIFTVYSQNPLPAAMMAYLAQIPRRLAYCRENPYNLLTNWIPDPEPYTLIRHQVRRDLDLVLQVGARAENDMLSLSINENRWTGVMHKMQEAGIDPREPWIIMHPGVSEQKRTYPEVHWISAAKVLLRQKGMQILLTGTAAEKALTDRLQEQMGGQSFSVAGLFDLEAFMLLIRHSALIISVNTVAVHIAAATSTPLIVLYALSNPQHLPWKATGKVLLFDVAKELQSKNEVICYVQERLMYPGRSTATPEEIILAACSILGAESNNYVIPELVPLRTVPRQ